MMGRARVISRVVASLKIAVFGSLCSGKSIKLNHHPLKEKRENIDSQYDSCLLSGFSITARNIQSNLSMIFQLNLKFFNPQSVPY